MRERPYFNSFSSKTTLRGKVHSTLIIQELQAIKYIKQHNINYQQAHLLCYVIYMMTATNKRYSYLRATAIRIDVHSAGENPINTPHTFHTRFVYGPGPYISRGPRRQPFASSHKAETCPYTWEKS
jgi:hypothetical protein